MVTPEKSLGPRLNDVAALAVANLILLVLLGPCLVGWAYVAGLCWKAFLLGSGQ